MPQIRLQNSTLWIQGGASEAIEVTIGDGNFTWTENRSIEYTLNRGKIDAANGGVAREGDDQPISVSFDILWDEYIVDGAGSVTPVEALKQEGAQGSSWVSSDLDSCTPYAVDLQLIRNLGDCFTGTNQYEKYVFVSFRYESIDHDVDAGTMSVSGTCQATRVFNFRDNDSDLKLIGDTP